MSLNIFLYRCGVGGVVDDRVGDGVGVGVHSFLRLPHRRQIGSLRLGFVCWLGVPVVLTSSVNALWTSKRFRSAVLDADQ